MLLSGSFAIPSFIAIYATPAIPRTFPIMSPAMMPIDMGSKIVVLMDEKSIDMPALASAKRGITTKLTGRCKSCSSLAAGEFTESILSVC